MSVHEEKPGPPAASGAAPGRNGDDKVTVEISSAGCTAFLQWALPRLGLRWSGFRKVRGQVCKRLRRRMESLGLGSLAAYRAHLEETPLEWQRLDGFCRITISRFYRDRGVFDHLRREIVPPLCRTLEQAGEARLRCLSLGCCGGEEPYTLALLWRFDLAARYPGIEPEIIATDSDPQSLSRAESACYSAGSLKDLPADWRMAAFDTRDRLFCLRPEFRTAVQFERLDMRESLPPGPFHLVLCRNLAFTYFDEATQRKTVTELAARMPSGSILLLGKHEHLPAGSLEFEAVSAHQAVYRRV